MEFTREQIEAFSSTESAVALLAGAGSGKTAVLVERYLKLMDSGLRPSEILTVTFTVDAATQMRNRIAARLREREKEDLAEEVESTGSIGTLHSFCFTLVDSLGELVGVPAIETLLTPFELAPAFEAAYQEWRKGLSPDELTRLLGLFSRQDLRKVMSQLFRERYTLPAALKRLKPDAPEREPFRLLLDLGWPLVKSLRESLTLKGHLTFDDLEYLALEILRKRPHQRHMKILVDEFQDTSPVQWEILQLLMGDDWRKLFIVGDPKQSIYSFRQADYRIFARVTRAVAENGGRPLQLSANFRTAPALLERLNHLSAPLFHLSTVPFTPMAPGLSPGGGELRVRHYPQGKLKAESAEAEVIRVVTNIRVQIDSGVTPGDIALLFRVGDRIPQYFAALREAGIPATCKQSRKLFSHYDVVDLFAFFKFLEKPEEDFRLGAFLRTSFCGWTEERMQALQTREGETWLEKLKAAGELPWLTDLAENGDGLADGALESLFRHSPYWPEDPAVLKPVLEALGKPEVTVTQAVTLLKSWEAEDIAVETVSREGDGGVRLMTVHGAKGLEFPHVYLVDNLRQSPNFAPAILTEPGEAPGIRMRVKGQLVSSPNYERLQEAKRKRDYEESRRILYVALTRARETLTVFLPEGGKVPSNCWAAILGKALETSDGAKGQEIPFTPPVPPELQPKPYGAQDLGE